MTNSKLHEVIIMLSKKKLLLIIILVILVAIGGYFLINYHQGKGSFSGEHNVLILCTDPSEQRPGIGAVDMAFVAKVKDGKLIDTTPVYPGGLAHPTLSPPASLRAEGVDVVYLHDSLWSDDLDNGTKIAQEIVKYHTNMSTDMVLVVTPDAIDAVVEAVGPVYSNGQEVTGSSIEFLRDDQSSNGVTRGNAIEGLADGILEAANNNHKKPALITTALDQYAKGNIQASPKDKFSQFLSYQGISSIIG